MAWNWQHTDWPNFIWQRENRDASERAFIEGAGVIIGASKHLVPSEQQRFSVELLSHEAIDTSAIEGEYLDRDSVQSSIQRQLGLAVGQRKASPAEAGIADMMVDLYHGLGQPLTEQDLFRWHGMIMTGRTDLSRIGAYRADEEAMQIVSGALHALKVHFEAPPSGLVPQEMAQFLAWFTATAPQIGKGIPPVTRAAVAHLWFESIHPFEDGNGRIGRAISEKALAQGLSTPAITGMAGTLLKHRKAYYAALESASRGVEIDDWLEWFSSHALEAQTRTLAQVEYTLAKSRFFDDFRGKLNLRQEKALLRMFAAGREGFTGGLSAANYMSITGATTATTTRDLADLVSVGAMVRTGDRKSTRYSLNFPGA